MFLIVRTTTISPVRTSLVFSAAARGTEISGATVARAVLPVLTIAVRLGLGSGIGPPVEMSCYEARQCAQSDVARRRVNPGGNGHGPEETRREEQDAFRGFHRRALPIFVSFSFVVHFALQSA